MEQFVLGLISGVLLMGIRELPQLAWERPVVYRRLASKSAGLLLGGVAVAVAGALTMFLAHAPKVGMALMIGGIAIAAVPVLAMELYLVIQDLRAAEAEHSSKQAAARKSTPPRYKPLRHYRRRP